MTTTPGYQPAPQGGGTPKFLADAASISWVKRIVEVVNSILRGKLNATVQVTLTASAGSTTITDSRISGFSFFDFEPLTAHAAAALYATPYVLLASQQQGSATFNHVNDANVDKTFNVLIIG